ncbi:MAG: tRNA (adenosine(37)-N6)-threonylcarbamoyltransferase complex dimerization subunit type 1 TsaB [Erysipelotrichaceae bacterium]|nr:tRNA (adenosine(37)-N6)-threonylcarbamoyltransferase complex dimerization subunit type 1 TsaB [Erysipelotrichaceae bacterium]
MKYTILLDSSNTSLTVGLADEENLVDSISYEAWQTQSEHMIPELDKLMNKYQISKDDIASVVVAIGPGSYTGVRIALTIAKTIATALKIDLYPVSSLQILKNGDKPSICLINARSDRSYIGVYKNDTCLLKDQIMKNQDVKEYILNHANYSICGETDYLKIEGHKADIAKEMWGLKPSLVKATNPLGVVPVYLRD